MSQKYVLVADQEPSIRTLLGAFLQEEGYTPVYAATLQEALEHLENYPVGLILTDLIEAHTRDELTSPLLLHQARPGTPIGIVTAWNLVQDAVLAQGFAFLISKPFDLDRVLEQVAAHFQSVSPDADQPDPH